MADVKSKLRPLHQIHKIDASGVKTYRCRTLVIKMSLEIEWIIPLCSSGDLCTSNKCLDNQELF